MFCEGLKLVIKIKVGRHKNDECETFGTLRQLGKLKILSEICWVLGVVTEVLCITSKAHEEEGLMADSLDRGNIAKF